MGPILKKFPLIPILILYTLAAYFSSGFYHWDEYYQILEFTALKWGKTTAQELPWEFHAKMRPWLQAAILTPLKFLGPHISVILMRVLMGCGHIFVLWKWFQLTKEKFSLKSPYYFYATFLLWFMPILLVRYSSESLSSLFLLACLYLFLKDDRKLANYLLLGSFAAIAFWSRFQVGVFLFFPMLWILLKHKIKQSSAMFGSFLLVCGVMVFIDTWGYGSFTLSPYEYFIQNIVHKKTSDYGINPWWDYPKWIFLKATPLISIPFLFGFFKFTKNKESLPLSLGLIAFYFIHQMIGHKEFRFLFPLIPLVPFFIFYGFKEIKVQEKVVKYFVALNAIGCLILFKPLHPIESFSKVVPPGSVQVKGPRSPEILTGTLRARFFYKPQTNFESQSSDVIFASSIEEHFKAAAMSGCKNTYNSRFTISEKDIKKNRSIWSLWECGKP